MKVSASPKTIAVSCIISAHGDVLQAARAMQRVSARVDDVEGVIAAINDAKQALLVAELRLRTVDETPADGGAT